MLRQRIVSAIVMLVVFLLVNFFVSDFLFALAMSTLAAFAGWEWSRLSGVDTTAGQIGFALIAALFSLLLVLYFPVLSLPAAVVKLASLLVVLFWLAVIYLFYRQPVKAQCSGRVDYSSLLAGLFLLGACVYFSCFLHTRSQGGSALLFVYAMCTVWVMDIGAYFAGKRFGRSKLAPSISPGKTWEGVAGGMAGAFVFAFLVLQVAGFSAERKFALVLATVSAAGASILGDLYESRMKRAAGYKDSSQLIPGHGGLLDRIDGVIAAVPVFAFAWIWF